jgi:predicted nucleotidyltransferase
MRKDRVIKTLRDHERELRAAGVVHVRIFGSVARGDDNGASDVDLMVEFDKSKRLTLVKLGSLEHRLSELLGTKVDLSSAEWMIDRVRRSAEREAVLAF